MSTDNTLEHYYSEIGNDTRFNITINTEKKYALRNTIDCLNNLNLDDDAVIIQVDGDDFLYDEKTQTSNLDVPNPSSEQHVCIISDVN